MVRILVADDHALMRSALRELFELQEGWSVCAEAADGGTAVASAVRDKPDVAVVDLDLPVLDGLGVLRRLRSEAPQVAALLYTGAEDERLPAEAEAEGAVMVRKAESPARLVATIREQLAAREPLPPRRVGSPAAHRLTPRETEVLRFLAEGKSNWSTGVILGISERTVETHRYNVMKKLALASVVELVHYAIQVGLVIP